MTPVPPRNLACRQLCRCPEAAHCATSRAGRVASTHREPLRKPQSMEQCKDTLRRQNKQTNENPTLVAQFVRNLPWVLSFSLLLWGKNKAFGEEVPLALGTFILAPERTRTRTADHHGQFRGLVQPKALLLTFLSLHQ